MTLKIIAIFLIVSFALLIAITVILSFFLKKFGMLSIFLRGQWILGLLTSGFILMFIVSGIALLAKAEWAVPVLCYTIYLWLIYLWLYGLKGLFDLVFLLKFEKATSLAQFVGRSKFFDEIIQQSIALSNRSVVPPAEENGEAHAVSDAPLEALLNDEEMFKTLLPVAVRKKIKRKVIGLLIHTIVSLTILVLIR